MDLTLRTLYIGVAKPGIPIVTGCFNRFGGRSTSLVIGILIIWTSVAVEVCNCMWIGYLSAQWKLRVFDP